MSADVRSEASLTFQEKWSEQCKDGELMPGYGAFDQTALSDFLPFMVVAKVDLALDSMPVILAGSAIRDFLGFEITGKDFLVSLEQDDKINGRPNRVAYHDHPCGRYEERDINFKDTFHLVCCLTSLPLMGSNGERLIVTFVEVADTSSSSYQQHSATSTGQQKLGTFIDIGADVPDAG